MISLLRISASLALLAIGTFFAILAYQAVVLPTQVLESLEVHANALHVEVRALRVDLRATEDKLMGQVESFVDSVDRHLENVEQIGDARMTALETLVDTHLERLGSQVGEGIVEIGKLRGDIRPVLASTDEFLTQASSTVAVLRPQMLGLIAAGKVTAGETAQAARRIDKSLPEFLEIGRRFGQSSAETAANVERITRPDRWWIKAAKIASPVAGGLLWGAVTGK